MTKDELHDLIMDYGDINYDLGRNLFNSADQAREDLARKAGDIIEKIMDKYK